METKKGKGKGRNGNLIPATAGGRQFTREDRVKGALASAAVRREKRRLSEIMEMLLTTKNKEGITRAELLCMKALDKAYKSGGVKEIKIIQDILGESVANVAVQGGGINLVVDDKTKADVLAKLMDGGE